MKGSTILITMNNNKLIIVGNHRIFHESQGGDLVSSKIKRIMLDAWDIYKKESFHDTEIFA